MDGTEADIAGENSSTYTLVDADLGTTLKVRVSFTDDASNSETLTSAATATVGAAGNTAATGAPTITGTAEVGETLTAVTTGIADADGLTSVSYAYQWIRVNGTEADIAGENSSTYTLVDADLGTTLKVRVSFTDDASNSETLTSAATATVVAAGNTAPTGAPTITGTAEVGETLTAGTTGIADADGLTIQLRVPVDSGDGDGGRHCGREFEHLHPGRRRPGHDPQGAGELQRRRQQFRDAHQRGDGDGLVAGNARPRRARTITQTGARTAASADPRRAGVAGGATGWTPPRRCRSRRDSVRGVAGAVYAPTRHLDPASMPTTGDTYTGDGDGRSHHHDAGNVGDVDHGIWVTLTLVAAPATGPTVTRGGETYAPPASNPVQDERRGNECAWAFSDPRR